MLPRIWILGLIVLSLSGCIQSPPSPTPTAIAQQLSPTNTSTPRPTATKTPTPRPTLKPESLLTQQAQLNEELYTITPNPTAIPTSTPVPPPPLTSHQWTTNPILLRFGQVGGDGANPLVDSLPSLILYSDGMLIYRNQRGSENGVSYIELWQTNLDRQQICSLLNTIDQTGFWNYDPSTYLPKGQSLPFDGGPSTVIEVNAWRSKQIKLNSLSAFLNAESAIALATAVAEPGRSLYIPAALEDTYRLLYHLKTSNAIPYRPTRLAVQIDIMTESQAGAAEWSLKQPKLIDIYNQSSSGQNPVMIKGEELSAIYEVFSNSTRWGSFQEGNNQFVVTVRPLLPYEDLDTNNDSYNPINTPDIYKHSMSCTPDDGILPIP